MSTNRLERECARLGDAKPTRELLCYSFIIETKNVIRSLALFVREIRCHSRCGVYDDVPLDLVLAKIRDGDAAESVKN